MSGKIKVVPPQISTPSLKLETITKIQHQSIITKTINRIVTETHYTKIYEHKYSNKKKNSLKNHLCSERCLSVISLKSILFYRRVPCKVELLAQIDLGFFPFLYSSFCYCCCLIFCKYVCFILSLSPPPLNSTKSQTPNPPKK